MKNVMFKAINGEEIIARLVDESEETLTVEKARVLVTHQTGPGQMQAGLMPWFVGAPNETVDVKKVHIFGMIHAIPTALEKGYNEELDPPRIVAASPNHIAKVVTK